MTVDTGCSSSLVAVHLACNSIWSGESTMALAAGVNVILEPRITIAYSQSRMMAPDGRCKFGDARADGYVRSEGAGVVVLKPLARAIADGDRIYAMILGSAVNNDGRSSGFLTTPGSAGQEEMLRLGLPPRRRLARSRQLCRGARHRHARRRSGGDRRARYGARRGPARRRPPAASAR